MSKQSEPLQTPQPTRSPRGYGARAPQQQQQQNRRLRAGAVEFDDNIEIYHNTIGRHDHRSTSSSSGASGDFRSGAPAEFDFFGAATDGAATVRQSQQKPLPTVSEEAAYVSTPLVPVPRTSSRPVSSSAEDQTTETVRRVVSTHRLQRPGMWNNSVCETSRLRPQRCDDAAELLSTEGSSWWRSTIADGSPPCRLQDPADDVELVSKREAARLTRSMTLSLQFVEPQVESEFLVYYLQSNAKTSLVVAVVLLLTTATMQLLFTSTIVLSSLIFIGVAWLLWVGAIGWLVLNRKRWLTSQQYFLVGTHAEVSVQDKGQQKMDYGAAAGGNWAPSAHQFILGDSSPFSNSAQRSEMLRLGWKLEVCNVIIYFGAFIYVMWQYFTKERCSGLDAESKFRVCLSAIQFEGSVVLLVPFSKFLMPLRWALYAPTTFVYMVLFFALRGVPGMPMPIVWPYFESSAILLSGVALVCFVCVYVSERMMRKRFVVIVERQLHAIHLVTIRQREEILRGGKQSCFFFSEARQPAGGSDDSEGERDAVMKASVSIAVKAQWLRLTQAGSLWCASHSAYVVGFGLSGFPQWVSKQAPVDQVRMIREVRSVLEIVSGIYRDISEAFENFVAGAGKEPGARRTSVTRQGVDTPSFVSHMWFSQVRAVGDEFMLVSGLQLKDEAAISESSLGHVFTSNAAGLHCAEGLRHSTREIPSSRIPEIRRSRRADFYAMFCDVRSSVGKAAAALSCLPSSVSSAAAARFCKNAMPLHHGNRYVVDMLLRPAQAAGSAATIADALSSVPTWEMVRRWDSMAALQRCRQCQKESVPELDEANGTSLSACSRAALENAHSVLHLAFLNDAAHAVREFVLEPYYRGCWSQTNVVHAAPSLLHSPETNTRHCDVTVAQNMLLSVVGVFTCGEAALCLSQTTGSTYLIGSASESCGRQLHDFSKTSHFARTASPRRSSGCCADSTKEPSESHCTQPSLFSPLFIVDAAARARLERGPPRWHLERVSVPSMLEHHPQHSQVEELLVAAPLLRARGAAATLLCFSPPRDVAMCSECFDRRCGILPQRLPNGLPAHRLAPVSARLRSGRHTTSNPLVSRGAASERCGADEDAYTVSSSVARELRRLFESLLLWTVDDNVDDRMHQMGATGAVSENSESAVGLLRRVDVGVQSPSGAQILGGLSPATPAALTTSSSLAKSTLFPMTASSPSSSREAGNAASLGSRGGVPVASPSAVEAALRTAPHHEHRRASFVLEKSVALSTMEVNDVTVDEERHSAEADRGPSFLPSAQPIDSVIPAKPVAPAQSTLPAVLQCVEQRRSLWLFHCYCDAATEDEYQRSESKLQRKRALMSAFAQLLLAACLALIICVVYGVEAFRGGELDSGPASSGMTFALCFTVAGASVSALWLCFCLFCLYASRRRVTCNMTGNLLTQLIALMAQRCERIAIEWFPSALLQVPSWAAYAVLVMMTVFSAPTGNVLGNGRVVWLYTLTLLSFLRPTWLSPTKMWLTGELPVSLIFGVEASLRSVSPLLGHSASNIYGAGINLVACLLLRLLWDAASREVFSARKQFAVLEREIHADHRRMTELISSLAPKGVARALMLRYATRYSSTAQPVDAVATFPTAVAASCSLRRWLTVLNGSVRLHPLSSTAETTTTDDQELISVSIHWQSSTQHSTRMVDDNVALQHPSSRRDLLLSPVGLPVLMPPDTTYSPNAGRGSLASETDLDAAATGASTSSFSCTRHTCSQRQCTTRRPASQDHAAAAVALLRAKQQCAAQLEQSLQEVIDRGAPDAVDVIRFCGDSILLSVRRTRDTSSTVKNRSEDRAKLAICFMPLLKDALEECASRYSAACAAIHSSRNVADRCDGCTQPIISSSVEFRILLSSGPCVGTLIGVNKQSFEWCGASLVSATLLHHPAIVDADTPTERLAPAVTITATARFMRFAASGMDLPPDVFAFDTQRDAERFVVSRQQKPSTLKESIDPDNGEVDAAEPHSLVSRNVSPLAEVVVMPPQRYVIARHVPPLYLHSIDVQNVSK